jgi:O-antigen/teichoic acid export membrane protein
MGKLRKESTYATILLYFGLVIGFFGTAIIRPKLLSAEEIGFLQVTLNMVSLFGSAFILGGHLLIIKMLPKLRTDDNKNRGLFRLIVSLGLIGCLVGMPMLIILEPFFFENNDGVRFQGIDYNFLFYSLLFMAIFAKTFFYLFDNYLRAYFISTPGVFSENVLLKALPIMALVLIYLNWVSYDFVVFFNLIIYIIPLFLVFYYLKKIKAINWTKPGPFTRDEKREMLGISSVGFMEIISYFIVLFIDVFMLKRLMNDEAVGIYTTMFFFGAVVSIPLKALIRIAHPMISEAFVKKDMHTISTIYQKSSNVLFVLGGFVFLLVWGNRYSIEQFLDPVYAQGIWVIFFIGLAHLVEVISSVNYQIISITPHYRFNLYMGLFTVILLIITNYIFIELYGLVGVAIGSLVSMVLVNLARHIFLVSKYKLSPFSVNTIKIVILCVLLFFVSEWIPNVDNLYWNAVIKTGILALLYLPAAYLFKCSEDFNVVANKYLTIFSRKSKK